MRDIELLSPATNFAVVQMKGRHFPGVVVQGDTLQSMAATVKKASEAMTDENSKYELLGLLEQLQDALRYFEETCIMQERKLPY